MRLRAYVPVAALFAACGSVSVVADAAKTDAPPGVADAPPGTPDAPPGTTDAPPGAPDAPVAGPTPRLYWTMDGNVNNSGSLSGYTLTTPASIGYAAGKFGQAASFASGQYSYVDGMHQSLATYAKVTIAFWMKEPGNVAGSAFLDNNNRQTSPYGGIQLGLTNTSVSLCASTTSNSYLSGGCNGFTAPSANTWHHWIVRYDGAGTGAGQGAPVEIYIDDTLTYTRPNDAANDPVWTPTGAPDRLYLGVSNAQLDDVRIYDQVFTVAEQCTYLVRGTWTGSSCTLP
jgi:hypothetical protein